MKKQFLAALAFASLLSQSVVSMASTAETKKTSEANKDVALLPSTKSKIADSRPRFIGGMPMINIGGSGIPPHIYGQMYVRRGTHKRSNKK